MIEATIDMLRARHREQVALIGVVGALFCDDLPEGVRRLKNARDSAREFAKTLDHRRDRERRRLAHEVASCADDLIPGLQQLVERSK
jgi:hypothetical protein